MVVNLNYLIFAKKYMSMILKISIIVPIYNVSKYIKRCLDSIICQECDDFELECILVNDCTTDTSMEIVCKMLADYHGKISFKVINHTKNEGLSAARNTGIKNAAGDFVYFVDSDDRLVPDALECMIECLGNVLDRSNIDVVVGNSYVCKNNQPAMTFYNNEPIIYDNNCEMALKKFLNREIFHTAWNKLVRRDFLLKNGIYFEKGILDEDLLWSYYVFLKLRRVVVVPTITYIYEDNPFSIMNTTNEKIARIVKSRVISCDKMLISPPVISHVEFYMYVFYVMTRAINLYVLNKKDPAVNCLGKELFISRDNFLSQVKNKRLFVLYLFFLTSKKPFYYFSNFRLFRRYYDRIARAVVIVSNRLKF